MKLHISEGNGKTLIPSFNLLAGGKNHDYDGYTPKTIKKNGLECIKGTCLFDCPGCYAKKMTRYPDVFKNLLANTITANEEPEKIGNYVKAYCSINWTRVFRWHDSGDIPSKKYLKMMIKTAEETPETRFYTYTKRFDLLEEIEKLPENLIINLSPWEGITDEKIYNELIQKGLFNAFIFDKNKDLKAIHCPAVNIKGKNTGIHCKECRRCFKKGNITAVYPH